MGHRIADLRVTDTLFVPAPAQQDAITRQGSALGFAFCHLTTDGGHVATVPAPGGRAARALIEDLLRPAVLGEDPMDHERIWQKLYWASQTQGRRGLPVIAMGVVDCAVWDLKGRITGQPLHKLLGAYRDRVPSYGSGINLNLSDEDLAAEMRGFADQGFGAVKMKVGHRDPRRDVERVRKVREAIGPSVALCLDANMAWSVTTAAAMARRLEPFDILWLEEPVLADEIQGLAELARASPIAIAAGENHYGKWEFRELLERRAVAYVQADVVRCGGVTEFVKIAAMADAHGLPVCPHFSVFTDAACVAAVPNGMLHEWVPGFSEPAGLLVEAFPRPEGGSVGPLDRPGFGLELRPDAVERYERPPGEAAADGVRRTTERALRWPPFL